MGHVRRAAVTGLFAFWLAPLPALAGSVSTDTQTQCQNGRCTRVQTVMIEDRQGRQGFVREDRWREGQPRRPVRGPGEGLYPLR